MAIPRECPMPGCMHRLPCFIHGLDSWQLDDMTADQLREAREDDAVTLATLRAENERLREALRDVIRAHDGMHTRTCSAVLDGLHLVDGDLNDGDCDCGATERRNEARAALKGGGR